MERNYEVGQLEPSYESDWFTEALEDSDDSDCDSEAESLSDCGDVSENLVLVAEARRAGQQLGIQAELVDSRSSCHISPYRDHFDSFSPIPPKSFCAANKETFAAIGIGEMIIDLPNGLDISQLRLCEVLYTPDATYTLISVGRLDDLGYTVKFAHGVCSIFAPDGERIVQILKDEKGLY